MVSGINAAMLSYDRTTCENGQLKLCFSNEAKLQIESLLGIYNLKSFTGLESVRLASSKYKARDAFQIQGQSNDHSSSIRYEQKVIIKLSEVGQRLTWLNGILAVLIKTVKKIYQFKNTSVSVLFSLSNFHHKSVTSVESSDENSISILAWHPHVLRLAVCFNDDVVRIFCKETSHNPVLKHRLQKNVCHISWMPLSSCDLAVSCDSGIILWSLDPLTIVGRPSGLCMSVLSCDDGSIIPHFSWHPKGITLASIETGGRSIVVWDTGMESYSTVHCGIAASYTKLFWSPDGNRLLAAMSSPVIRIFETTTWNHERWSLQHPLKSCVWSRCGKFLLFVTALEPVLYCISFASQLNLSKQESSVGGSNLAAQLVDFSSFLGEIEETENTFGECMVSELAWDEKCEKLAVSFTNSKHIAIFKTYIHPSLQLVLCGFISGEDNTAPTKIHFQSCSVLNRASVNVSTLLTVVWSNANVNHYPLLCGSSSLESSFPNESAIHNLSQFYSSYVSPNVQSPTTSTPVLSRLFTSP